jgi:peptide/nickel transport system substrate-binding protein
MVNLPLIHPFADRSEMTRRRFMMNAMAAGATIVAADLAWTKAARATPVKGGHLRLGLAGGSTTDTLDPSPWGDTFMTVIGYAVRGGLTEFGADGLVKPDVAESWEFADGAKKWIFKLQRGAAFSNGKSLTADDVVASLNFHRGDKSQSGAKALLESVTDIKAEDKNTVIVTLSSAIVDFPYSLTDQHFNIFPSVDGQPDWRSGIGAGPYVLEQFEPGVRAVLKRNPNSYKNAYLESAELIGIADPVARQAALTTKTVDVINRVELKTARLLGQRPGLRVEQTAGRLEYTLALNTEAELFKNPDVRTALKYAIDREEILKVVFQGYGRVGNDQPITPAYRYYNDQLPSKRYDPDKARFHLKKAGYDSISFDFHTSEAAFNGAVDLGVLYQQRASPAGITINVVREPSDSYWEATNSRRYDVYSTYWSGRATEDAILTVSQSAKSPWNDSRWNNPQFSQLLVEARKETDEAKRKALYFELQQLNSEDGGVIIPIFANSVFALADKVQHPEVVAGNWELDGGRLIERWWVTA